MFVRFHGNTIENFSNTKFTIHHSVLNARCNILFEFVKTKEYEFPNVNEWDRSGTTQTSAIYTHTYKHIYIQSNVYIYV
jgi:hypothetical protein